MKKRTNNTVKSGSSPASCSPLTVDILKTLKFGLRMHLNGGENYSTRIEGNDEYGLYVTTHTDGSPNYRITEKRLGVDDTEEITLDLMAKERDLQGFCDAYNSRANDERIRGDADARKQTGTLSPSDDAACSENQPE